MLIQQIIKANWFVLSVGVCCVHATYVINLVNAFIVPINRISKNAGRGIGMIPLFKVIQLSQSDD